MLQLEALAGLLMVPSQVLDRHAQHAGPWDPRAAPPTKMSGVIGPICNLRHVLLNFGEAL